MKSFLLVACLCLSAVAVFADEEATNAYMELVNEHIPQCTSENGLTPEQLHDIHKTDLSDEVKRSLGCANACVMQKMGIMDGSEVIMDKVKSVVLDKILTDPVKLAAQMKVVENCYESTKGKADHCDMGYDFTYCVTKDD